MSRCVDREGNVVGGCEGQDAFLTWLYGSGFGRQLVKILVRPWVSKVGGWALNRRISALAIPGFVRKNGIDTSRYEERNYRSYNDFFTRKMKEDRQQIDREASHLIAPCDSRLTVHPITRDATFHIKQMDYTLESLLKNKELAEAYEGGTLLLFRLTVADYHRYCYLDDGKKSKNHWIEGVFHTVNPAAGEVCPIYKENTRCYSLLESEHFGEVLVMEVGALMVGKILNYHEEREVQRGEEKGRFEFGGSTILVLLKPDTCKLDEDILENSRNHIETKVCYGERIGVAI